MALALYDPDGFSGQQPQPRHWPVLEIARRRSCNAPQTELLVWLFVRLGHRPGTVVVDRVESIREGACSSEGQFRRALAGLERAGLVQRDRERSGPGRDVLHVLRAYQPELQQFFDFDTSQSDTIFFDEGAPAPAPAPSLSNYIPPQDVVAESKRSTAHGPYDDSAGSGTEAALRRLPQSSTSGDVQGQEGWTAPVADHRPASSSTRARPRPGEVADQRAACGSARASQTTPGVASRRDACSSAGAGRTSVAAASGSTHESHEPLHAGALFAAALPRLPTAENLLHEALQVADAFAALGDRQPILIACAKVALLRSYSTGMNETLARIFRDAPQRARPGEAARYAMGAIKAAALEVAGVDWSDLKLPRRVCALLGKEQRKRNRGRT